MKSFSEPRWTEEDERREIQALTDSEREQVCIDLFGSSHHQDHPDFTTTTTSHSSSHSSSISRSLQRASSFSSVSSFYSVESAILGDKESKGEKGVGDNNSDDGVVCGNSGTTVEKDSVDKPLVAKETAAVLHMVELIKTIPTEGRNSSAAFFLAMKCNPNLVLHHLDEQQRDKLRMFLKQENGDPTKAAKRVCSYWNLRKKIFVDPTGQDSNFFCRPVTLTDGGIMNNEDLRLLRTGVLQFLPDDSQGRKVLFFNKASFRNPKDFPRECLARCMFYMLHHAMTSTSTEQDVVLLCNFKNYDASHFDRKCFKIMMEMINHCLPVRVVALHYCYGSKKSAFDLVLPTIKSIMGPNLRQRLCLHVGTNDRITHSLAKFGMIHIPQILGGDYVVPQKPAWVKRACDEELSNHLSEPVGSCELTTQIESGSSSTVSGKSLTTTSSSMPVTFRKTSSSKASWNRAA